MCFIWGFTFCSVIKLGLGFTTQSEEDKHGNEVYNRLISIFQKNRYGFHTRIFSDFDVLIEIILNQKFVDQCSSYYDDPISIREIEDHELGLYTDFTEQDIKHLVKDKDHSHPGAGAVVLMWPSRVGTNYPKSDDLSCYKILPKKTV